MMSIQSHELDVFELALQEQIKLYRKTLPGTRGQALVLREAEGTINGLKSALELYKLLKEDRCERPH